MADCRNYTKSGGHRGERRSTISTTIDQSVQHTRCRLKTSTYDDTIHLGNIVMRCGNDIYKEPGFSHVITIPLCKVSCHLHYYIPLFILNLLVHHVTSDSFSISTSPHVDRQRQLTMQQAYIHGSGSKRKGPQYVADDT